MLSCAWCDKLFTPTDDGCLYALMQAGITICLDCCDKWEAKEVELHMSKLHAYIDEVSQTIKTANGVTLPIKILKWHKRLGVTGWQRIGNAVDELGQRWTAKSESANMVRLKPVH